MGSAFAGLMTGLIFTRVLYIGAPRQIVWDALTDNEYVTRYHFVPIADLDLRVGGRIDYGDPDDLSILGEIREVEPGVRLVHSFAFDGYPDPVSEVTYELVDMEGMCRLTLTHSGFPEENETWGDINEGWDVILSSLKTLLETGEVLPWPETHELYTDEDGVCSCGEDHGDGYEGVDGEGHGDDDTEDHHDHDGLDHHAHDGGEEHGQDAGHQHGDADGDQGGHTHH